MAHASPRPETSLRYRPNAPLQTTRTALARRIHTAHTRTKASSASPPLRPRHTASSLLLVFSVARCSLLVPPTPFRWAYYDDDQCAQEKRCVHTLLRLLALFRVKSSASVPLLVSLHPVMLAVQTLAPLASVCIVLLQCPRRFAVPPASSVGPGAVLYLLALSRTIGNDRHSRQP
jgi:hypothetical protein